MILQSEDIDPTLLNEEDHNWFMCCHCSKDLIAGEMVCRFPKMDGQIVQGWNLIHPLCMAKILINEAAHQLDESVRV